MISQEEYEAAVAEELNYRPYEEYQQEIKSTYSYFTDEVIKDVINDLRPKRDIPVWLRRTWFTPAV